MRSTATLLSLTAVSAALLCAVPAFAQEAANAGPGPVIVVAAARPVIVLAAPQVDGTDVDDRAVAVVSAHLRSLDLDVRVVRPDAAAWDLTSVRDGARKLITAASARGALWIDAASEEDLGLYALQRDGVELYGRRVTSARGKTATALESLAGIATAVGEELAQGHATGLPKVDVGATDPASAPVAPSPDGAPGGGPTETRRDGSEAAKTSDAPPEIEANGDTKAPPKAAVSRPMITASGPDSASGDARRPAIAAARGSLAGPTPWPMLAFSASYVGGTFGGSVPWQNGASLRASFAPMQGLYLGAGYDVIAPSKGGDGRGSFELTRHPVFAGGGYRLAASARFDLQFGARATFDVTQRDMSEGGRAPHVGGPGGGPGAGGGLGAGGGPGPVQDRSFTTTGLLFSAAPVAEAFFLVSDQLRMNAMIGVDFPLAYSSVSGAPAGPAARDSALAWDPIRFIAGVGFEYGVVLPSRRKSAQTASR